MNFYYKYEGQDIEITEPQLNDMISFSNYLTQMIQSYKNDKDEFTSYGTKLTFLDLLPIQTKLQELIDLIEAF